MSFPASPNSSFIFILFGTYLLLADRSTKDIRYAHVQKVLIAISIFIASLTLYDLFTGSLTHISWLLYLTGNPTPLVIQGQMAPVSAVLFIVLSCGLLCHRKYPNIGKVAGLLTATSAAVVLLGYWYGAPILYGGTVKPVTFLTALCFTFTSIALLMRTSPGLIHLLANNDESVFYQILRFFLPFITLTILLEGWIITQLVKKTEQELVLAVAILTIICLIITVVFSHSFSRIITLNLDNANKKRIEAEKSLRDSLVQIKIATQAAKMGFWIWNLTTDEVIWDKQLYELYGISDTIPITLETWVSRIHPDERPNTYNLARMKKRNEFHSEFKIILPDSSVKIIEGHGKILAFDNGTSERMVGINWDITPKIRLINSLNTKNHELGTAYEELASQDEELQAQVKELESVNNRINSVHQFIQGVISQAGEGIIALNFDKKVNTWNLFMERYTGISSKEILGENISYLYNKIPDFKIFHNHLYINQALAGRERVTQDISFQHLHSGKKQWLTATFAPHLDITGSIIGVIIIVQDITSRKEIQDRLVQSETLLKSSESLGKIGGWELDIANNTIFWTEETYIIHEVDTNLPPGGDENTVLCFSCFHETDKKMLLGALDQCVSAGKPYVLECPFTTKKGTHLWVRTQAEAEWEEERIVRVHGTIMDITKEKLFVEDIKKERTHHRRILDAMPDGICIIDHEYKITYTNPVITEIFGDSNGKFCFQYINNRSDICPWCKNEEILSEKSITCEWEDPISKNIYELYGVPSYSPEGEICALYFFHNITDLRNTQKKLAETNEYLSRLIQHANVPILVWNANHQIKEFNYAFEMLSGYKRKDVINKPYNILFPSDQYHDLKFLFDTNMVNGRLYEKEMPIVRPNGDLIPVIWNAAKINDSNGCLIGVIAQGRDITREKQLEVEKTIALTQIQRNFAELAILNDGIRNPLTILALLTETYCPEKYAEFENQIIKIDQIVNQLDIRWVESESVLNYLNKHYMHHASYKKEKSN